MKNLAELSTIPEFIIELKKRFPKDKKIRIAFLGYIDLMLNSEEWVRLGVDDTRLRNRDNFEKLKGIHGRPDVGVVPTLASAIEAVIGDNFELTVFDFQKVEGTEVEWDFNFPIDKKFENKFDVIFDAGTCEHIFNFPQAVINIQKMLCLNGVVWHGGPLCWPNHGFYGYNPTLFCDFYEDNGCKILELFLRTSLGDGQFLTINNVPKYGRFKMSSVLKDKPELLALEYNVCVLIEKIKHCTKITFPIQQKYRDMSNWA